MCMKADVNGVLTRDILVYKVVRLELCTCGCGYLMKSQFRPDERSPAAGWPVDNYGSDATYEFNTTWLEIPGGLGSFAYLQESEAYRVVQEFSGSDFWAVIECKILAGTGVGVGWSGSTAPTVPQLYLNGITTQSLIPLRLLKLSQHTDLRVGGRTV